MIAMQYLFTGMAMAMIGGYLAYVFRMQQGFPNQNVPGFGLVTPGKYNAVVTMHGTIMIFWVAMPVLIAAFGNFLIPLMIGCDDMAFPRINRLSYQIFLLSAIVLLGILPGEGRRVRRRLDGLSSAFGQRRLQLDAHRRHALAGGGGAGIRRVSAGRYQFHRDGNE